MKTKRTKRPKATKLPRTTLAKRINSASSIRDKLDVALGAAHNPTLPLQTDQAVLGMLEDTKIFWQFYLLGKTMEDPAARLACFNAVEMYFKRLGLLFRDAIVDGDYKLFSRIAAILQFNRRPETHRLYADMLTFCERNRCGTEESPCDPWELLPYLKGQGHKFTQTYENQLPRTLHAVCKKLGVHLLTKKAGRPPKNLQR